MDIAGTVSKLWFTVLSLTLCNVYSNNNNNNNNNKYYNYSYYTRNTVYGILIYITGSVSWYSGRPSTYYWDEVPAQTPPSLRCQSSSSQFVVANRKSYGACWRPEPIPMSHYPFKWVLSNHSVWYRWLPVHKEACMRAAYVMPWKLFTAQFPLVRYETFIYSRYVVYCIMAWCIGSTIAITGADL